MSLTNAQNEARPQAIRTAGTRTWGVTYRGLDAALVGAVNTAVARFADPLTTTTRRLNNVQDPASSALADPVTVITTADLGTSFVPVRRGLYKVNLRSAVISAAGAVAVNAILSVDGVAADLVAATAPTVMDGETRADSAAIALVAGAGAIIPFKLSTHVIVLESTARPVVRLLLTNGAGVVPVAGTVSLTQTTMDFTWLRDHA